MRTYQHGGDVNSFAKQCGCKAEEVLDLSSNINFITPSVDFSAVTLNSYPNYEELLSVVANHFRVEHDEIELFNGGSSAIFSLMRFFKNQTCTIYSPAYLEYKKAALLHGKKVTLINRFSLMNKEIEENSLVVFVNPSTPDGKFYDLENLIELWIKKNCTILVDESFLEFCDGASISHLIYNYDKLYILKSMTKFYGCAGVRAGVVISSKTNISALKEREPLWKISQLDTHFLINALKDRAFVLSSKQQNSEAKKYLAEIIKDSPLFEFCHSSDANFFLVKLASLSAKEFQEKLLPHKIMVRDCSNFDFLDDSYVRIAVKDMDAMKRFRQALCSLK